MDDARPVVVAPISFDPEKALAHYRVRYWLHAYADHADVDGEVLRGVWYALQREGVPWPVSVLSDPALRNPHVPAGPPAQERPAQAHGPRRIRPRMTRRAHDWPAMIAAAIARAPPHPDLAALSLCSPHDIARAGVLLCYAPSERIVVPARVGGHICLLVQRRRVRGRVRL